MSAMTNPFRVGHWIQWTTEHQIKRGEVIFSGGVSLIIRWLDGEEQVFPSVEHYYDTDFAARNARMEIIERPREASRIEREAKRGVMSVSRAASALGTTPKRVRAMLRSGQLKGVSKDGKWVSVDL